MDSNPNFSEMSDLEKEAGLLRRETDLNISAIAKRCLLMYICTLACFHAHSVVWVAISQRMGITKKASQFCRTPRIIVRIPTSKYGSD